MPSRLTGLHRRILPAVLAALVPLATLAAPAPVTFTRGPLTRSVQNESDAAIDRACAWLAARQNPAGYWGESDAGLTAVCALALAGSGEELPPAERATVDRAVAWLASPSATNALPSTLAATNATAAAALAWRDMALAVFSPATPPDTNFLSSTAAPDAAGFALREAVVLRLVGAAPAAAGNLFPVGTGDFCADAQRALVAGDSASASLAALRGEALVAARKVLADLRRGLPGGGSASCWRFARCVNRSLGGEVSLTAGEEVVSLPWRSRLANFWTTSQRIDDQGRGHWKDSVEETAFAVLLLKEL